MSVDIKDSEALASFFQENSPLRFGFLDDIQACVVQNIIEYKNLVGKVELTESEKYFIALKSFEYVFDEEDLTLESLFTTELELDESDILDVLEFVSAVLDLNSDFIYELLEKTLINSKTTLNDLISLFISTSQQSRSC